MQHPSDGVVKLFLSVMFECKVQGYGYVNVEWRKLGSALPNTAIVNNTKFTNEVSSILKITKMAGHYDGMYRCVASNTGGQTTSKYANLSVQGKSDASVIMSICSYTCLTF